MEKTFKIEEFIRTNKRINKLSAKQAVKLEEIERKFIIMSRIAVALRRKGLYCSITIHQSGYCNIFVAKHDGDDCVSVDYVESCDATEAELLDWWSAIENGVE